MHSGMAEQPWGPETPDEDLPQDPGIPGGPPAPEPERDGGMQDPIRRLIRTGSTHPAPRRSRRRSTEREENGRSRL